MALVVVVGTHTEVGKTWVTAALVRHLIAEGWRVAVRKPVQSFAAEGEPAGGEPTDAVILAAASGASIEDVCPSHRWYPRAWAPPMAADALGRPRFTIDDLVGELRWPADAQIRLVETVGGPRSPMAHDGDAVDLLARLGPDAVLLVADAGLGVINAVRLSSEVIAATELHVMLNRFDPTDELHRLNARWLIDRGYDVSTDVAACARGLIGLASRSERPIQ